MKTKTKMLALLMLSLSYMNGANAQISVGTRHGISISTLSKTGDLADNDEMIATYTGGLFVTLPVKGDFAIQPELNYVCKGRSNEITEFETSEFSSRYHYLQVPVMLRYNSNVTGNENTTLYFTAGPYASALLKSQCKLKNCNEWSDDNYDNEDKDPDLGVIFGMGVTFPVKNLKLQADLRYDMGSSKLNFQPDDYRTKALSLSLGIMF
jgi:hypothetical protein